MTETIDLTTAKPTGKRMDGQEARERGLGSIGRVNGSRFWYIWYYGQDGKRRRESTKTTDSRKANKILRTRLVAIDKGESVDFRTMRYEDLRALLVADYQSHGKITPQDGKYGRKNMLKPLDEFFTNVKVSAITTDMLRKFVAARKSEGVSGPTANRNLALLRRMFMLAIKEGKLQSKPYFPMEKESKPRKGFVERPEFEQLRDTLPEHLHPLVTFLYESGCRYGAATEIMWEWVKLEEGIIEIPAGVTKNDDALTLPLSTELLSMLNKRFKDDSPVFDSMNFRKEWEKACVKIGKGVIVEMKTPVKKPKPGEKKWNYWWKYTGLIPHDLRRSAVRNSIRAGNDQATAMSISGHRTVSTFQRYNIINAEDKKLAMKKIEQAARDAMASKKVSDKVTKADLDTRTVQSSIA
jgi:integrase